MTSPAAPASPPEPPPDCAHCPRLVDFRAANRQRHSDYHNRPVASFGPADARLLVVGLAPGLHGANATGRPFTGDHAGELLYATLHDHGFSRGRYAARADDGLTLVDCRITNAVRCVPPENKPVGAETSKCRRFLTAEIAALDRLTVILTLGQLAHRSVLACLGVKPAQAPFAHGAVHRPASGRPALAASYHCSRYNTNTGKLTPAMFDAVFREVRRLLDEAA